MQFSVETFFIVLFKDYNSYSGSKEMSRVSWNPPLVCILSDVSPVHVITPHFFESHFPSHLNLG